MAIFNSYVKLPEGIYIYMYKYIYTVYRGPVNCPLNQSNESWDINVTGIFHVDVTGIYL